MKEKKITKAMHSCRGPPLQLVIILTSCEPVPRTPGPSGLPLPLQPWPAFVLCPRAQGSRLCRRNTSSLTYLERLVHSDRQSRRT